MFLRLFLAVTAVILHLAVSDDSIVRPHIVFIIADDLVSCQFKCIRNHESDYLIM